jgi:hypothetical protein
VPVSSTSRLSRIRTAADMPNIPKISAIVNHALMRLSE